MLSLTGDEIRSGQIQRNSFDLAADEINRSGGVNGRPLRLIIEDDNGQPDLAAVAAEKLILQDRVVVLTGASLSESAWAIAAIAEKRRVPFLITSGSDDEITEQGWGYVFRICPPLSDYFPPLLSFLKDVVHLRTLAIVHGHSLYGDKSANYMEGAFRNIGGKVVAREFIRVGSTDFRPILARLKEANPDMVFMSSLSIEGALLLRQSRDLNYAPKVFVGAAQGFTIPNFVLLAGESAEHVFSIDLWSPRLPYAGAQKYFDDYVLRFLSSTNYHGAEAYACLQVIADALKRTNSSSGDGIRQALATTDIDTVFGPVRFVSKDQKNQQNFVRTFLGQWISGTLEIVWPKESASARYVYPVPPLPPVP